MELTQKTFRERLEYIQQALEQDATLNRLQSSLHEKGVECAILIPLLEVVLEFDALRDIKYEHESAKMYQRFDFLLDDRFLIEAKALNAQLVDHHRQVQKYIRDNPSIDYGLLTNGIHYQIWILRTYIERVCNRQLPDTPAVVNVFEVSLEGDGADFVLKALGCFGRSRYRESFETVARIAGYYAGGGRGRTPILHEEKDVNESLCERIKQKVAVEKGVYYDDIKQGRMRPGDKLTYENPWVKIAVEVTKTGTVLLRKGGANVTDVVGAINNGWQPLLNLIASEWSKEDAEFQDPLQIIRMALNKQRLYHQERYQFRHMP